MYIHPYILKHTYVLDGVVVLSYSNILTKWGEVWVDKNLVILYWRLKWMLGKISFWPLCGIQNHIGRFFYLVEDKIIHYKCVLYYYIPSFLPSFFLLSFLTFTVLFLLSSLSFSLYIDFSSYSLIVLFFVNLLLSLYHFLLSFFFQMTEQT